MRALFALVTGTHTPEREGDEEQRHQPSEGKNANRNGGNGRFGVSAFNGGGEDRGHGNSLVVRGHHQV